MRYKSEITDLLNTTISSMTFPVIIGTVTVTATGYIIRCDDIYFAQSGFDITINSVVYRITAINQSTETLTIDGVGTIVIGDTFDMYTPYFFHGTPIATEQEIKSEPNSLNKTPMLWLWENFTEKFYDDFSSLDRDIDLEIFALTQADFDQWLTDDAYSNAIKPMKRLIDLFIQALKDDSTTYETDTLTYDSENYSKFGVFIRDKGSSKNLFTDKLSGIGIKFKLTLLKTDECAIDFNVDPQGIGAMAIGTTFIIA